MANAESVSGNLKTSTAQLGGISNNLNKFSTDLANANIKQTMDHANQSMAGLQAAIDKINNGTGSLGLLLNDDKMYKNLTAATANLNSLFIDIKAHPKDYVSFSVFGGGKKKE